MLIAALCALTLLGCDDSAPDMAPVVGGVVINPGAGRYTLSPHQLAGCVEWLKASRKEWGKLRNTPPSPVQSIAFSHSDGARTYVEFYAGRPGWDKTLLIRNYDKGGKLQFTGVEDFDESDITQLKSNLPGPQ
jgi:hypothetical protein